MAKDNPPASSNEITAADAARFVYREVPFLDEKNKPTGQNKQASVRAKEVLSFRDYGDYVVVVTTDGQKLRGEKAAAK